MNKLERAARDDDTGKKGLKKRAAVSTDGDRPSKAARTEVSSGTRWLKNIHVPRCRIIENEEVEVVHFLKARDVKENEVLLIGWENPDVMAYVT